MAAPTAPSTRSRSPGCAAGRRALGDVLVLRRRPRRQSGGRRPQPRQHADLHRDDSAGGDPRSRISRDVHPMVAAARQRRARASPRRPRRDLRDGAAGGAATEAFLFAERGKFPPLGVAGGGRRRSTISPTPRAAASTSRRWCPRWSASSSSAASRAAGIAGRRRLRRPPDARARPTSPATSRSATPRARRRARLRVARRRQRSG